MRILFTGASSFTGFHFVNGLLSAGHELVCPLRGTVSSYNGVRRARIEGLQSTTRLVESTSFGSEAFLALMRGAAPLDLLCHHGAEVANYKSPDFDPLHALQNNSQSLPLVLKAFKESRGKALVLTGTIFEPDEGSSRVEEKRDQKDERRKSARETKGQRSEIKNPRSELKDQNSELSRSSRAFSPYGLSKGLTWQMFRYYCEASNIPIGKFVLPNPFGPFEEPRFTAYLMDKWQGGNPAQVKTPDYIRDNCHVRLLSLAYARFADGMISVRGGAISTH